MTQIIQFLNDLIVTTRESGGSDTNDANESINTNHELDANYENDSRGTNHVNDANNADC